MTAEQRLTTTSFPFDPVSRRNSSSPEISCTIWSALFFAKWTVYSSQGARRGGCARNTVTPTCAITKERKCPAPIVKPPAKCMETLYIEFRALEKLCALARGRYSLSLAVQSSKTLQAFAYTLSVAVDRLDPVANRSCSCVEKDSCEDCWHYLSKKPNKTIYRSL